MMKKQLLVSLSLLTLAICPWANAKTGKAVVPAEKAVLDNKVIEAADPSLKAKAQGETGVVGTVNADAKVENQILELSEKCSGNCGLVDAMEGAVRSPDALELGAEAQANARLAVAHAAELTKTGMDSEAALTKAVTDMNLDPEQIKENCK